jgi:nucleotide-binding universal stress UspA family protein
VSPADAPVAVGIDGSACAEAALRWAADQAAATGSPLEIVTAWDWPRSYGWVVPVPSDFDPAADAAKLLAAGQETVRAAHPEVRCSGTVAQGSAPVALVDVSRRVRLLVVGSRGHGELAGMLIGSVSQYCVAHAHCPVVVVRGEHGPAEGAPAGSDGEHASPEDQGREAAAPR